ncbi:hypothetical protein CLIB1423_32S00958 [[Candida] railenensis]|uniref:Uncharacterized protein n=1 Tax=[Candida] railenensis TaxID=45579 RepID=A0A9P0QW61_9ASCO|nr:hypothetical protein CLIB1423_32S00958 [[Candida] railenensis]
MSASMTFAQSYILASRVRSKLTKEASNPKSSLRVLVTQANMLDNLMDHIATETAKRNQKLRAVSMQEDNEEAIDSDSDTESDSEDEEEEEEFEVGQSRRVSFDLSTSRGRQLHTSVAEYEVESDSDSEDSDFDSDSDSDYYYSSDDEEISEGTDSAQYGAAEALDQLRRSAGATQSMFKELPSVNLHYLSPIREEEEAEDESDVSDDQTADDDEEEVNDNGVPGLCRSLSLSDDEDFESEHYKLEHSSQYYKPRYQESIDGRLFKSNYKSDHMQHGQIPHLNHQHVNHQRHNAIMSMESIL